MVSVERHPAARTGMYTLCQCLFLAMPTARAVLAGVRGVHRYKHSTGPCCLVREKCSELRPRRILDTFGEAMIVDHPIDRQVFDGNHIEAVDQATTLLMSKVRAPVPDPLMDTRHNPPAFPAFRGALGGSRQFPLRALQVFFIRAQELWAWDTFPSREGGKTQQAHVNAYRFSRGWEWLYGHFARYRHVPLARRRATDGARFRCAFQGAMLHNAQRSNLRQLQDAIGQLTAVSILREGHRIVTAIATETRIAWFAFAGFTPPKVCLEGQVNPHRDVLQDLRVYVAQLRTVRLEVRQGGLLSVVGQRLLSFLPSTLPVLKEVVVQTPAFLKLILQEVRLFFCWLQSVFHRFRHVIYYSPKTRREQALFAPIEGARRPLLISPWINPGGLRRIC